MKTKCYCIYCPRHPLFDQRKDSAYPVGWEPGNMIWKEDHQKVGKDVDCLKPVGDVFVELDLEVEEQNFPETAYGDGCAMTGFIGNGFIVYAGCGNEEYKD